MSETDKNKKRRKNNKEKKRGDSTKRYGYDFELKSKINRNEKGKIKSIKRETV